MNELPSDATPRTSYDQAGHATIEEPENDEEALDRWWPVHADEPAADDRSEEQDAGARPSPRRAGRARGSACRNCTPTRRPARSGRLRYVPATVVVGAQWGDEGKGKIVDLLAQRSDVVCRYQGGPNAGHTIIVGDETFKIRQTPSGVISGKVSVIGAGCVVDPEVLIAELDELEARGIDTSVVVALRQRAPDHAVAHRDRPGLGAAARQPPDRHDPPRHRPRYADKASRIGIRVQDVLDPKILRQKIEVALAEKNVWLERVYEVDGFDLEEVATRYEGYAQRLRPIVGDASLLVDEALRAGKDVLFEGAQATLLDLDHGTYPFVTSSNPIASGACDRASASARRGSTACSASRRRT